MIAKSIQCVGKVQGVYFRASTKETAKTLGIRGWVKNQMDGSVLIHAEGEEEALDQLIGWCEKGPVYAEVKSVEVNDSVYEGFKSFEITH